MTISVFSATGSLFEQGIHYFLTVPLPTFLINLDWFCFRKKTNHIVTKIIFKWTRFRYRISQRWLLPNILTLNHRVITKYVLVIYMIRLYAWQLALIYIPYGFRIFCKTSNRFTLPFIFMQIKISARSLVHLNAIWTLQKQSNFET